MWHSTQLVLLISLLFLTPLWGNTQGISSLNTGKIVELECVQTPAKTFITASMERIYLSSTERQEQVLIHRSTDLGASWQFIDSVHGTMGAVDPVLTTDDSGNVFLVVMNLISNSIIDLDLYKSDDDGLSWKYVSSPNQNLGLADYPQIISKGNGELFLVFNRLIITSESYSGRIIFKKSMDGGLTWSKETAFINDSIFPMGPDISSTNKHGLVVSFGQSLSNHIYLKISDDLGESWSDSLALNLIDETHTDNITKPFGDTSGKYIGMIVHKPHKTTTPINYIFSKDSGSTWKSYFIADGAYAQGIVDDSGTIHIIYNQKNDNDFCLNYISSEDYGESFSSPLTFYSAPFESAEYGEYQSIIKDKDGYIYIAFCDWADESKAKMLVFPRTLSLKSHEKNPSNFLFPNPANDLLQINMTGFHSVSKIKIFNTEGKLMFIEKPIGGDIHSMNVSQYPAGIYYVMIQETERYLIEKFIKR